MAANINDANGIELARSRFEHWRKTRSRKTPIPEKLWAMAVDVARHEGVNRTAQQLHLDGGKLKRLLVAADDRVKRKRRRHGGFVELIAPVPAANPGCVIEFETVSGSQNAHLLGRGCSAGLGGSAARLAVCRAMIQITAQMRVLVAIEPVDGRKYAPSTNMRSRAVSTRTNGRLRSRWTAHN